MLGYVWAYVSQRATAILYIYDQGRAYFAFGFRRRCIFHFLSDDVRSDLQLLRDDDLKDTRRS